MYFVMSMVIKDYPEWEGECMFHRGPPSPSKLGSYMGAEEGYWLASSQWGRTWWYHSPLVVNVNELDWI